MDYVTKDKIRLFCHFSLQKKARFSGFVFLSVLLMSILPKGNKAKQYKVDVEKPKVVKEYNSWLHGHTCKNRFLFDSILIWSPSHLWQQWSKIKQCLSWFPSVYLAQRQPEAWSKQRVTFREGLSLWHSAAGTITCRSSVNIYNTGSFQPYPEPVLTTSLFFQTTEEECVLLFSNSLDHFIWFLWWLANSFQVSD